MAFFDGFSVAKLLLLGDSEVGKSCIIEKLADDTFSSTYIHTIRVEHKDLMRSVKGHSVMIRIWDTTGEKKSCIVTDYYKWTTGVMVVYDVTNETSFNNVKQWMTAIEEHAPNVQAMVVGNKCDLDSELRMVSTDRGKLLAEEYGAMFIEVSAKTGENIEHAFLKFTEDVLMKEKIKQLNPDNCPD